MSPLFAHKKLGLISMSILAIACQSQGPSSKDAASKEDDTSIVITPLEVPEPIDLLAQKDTEIPSRVIQVSDAKIWQPCYQLFETGGEPRSTMKVDDEAKHAEMLWGCEVEAYARGEQGERYYAYGLKSEERLRASDQRIVAYDKEGALLWHHTIDRDSDAMNFASSRRSSFIVDFHPYLVCGGTRWDGSLEYICAKKQEGGAIAWQGKLSQWSGTNPIGHEKSLTFGDITTLKKIYPWEGVERTSAPLEGTGGYSALYATDGKMHVFSANRIPWKTLTGVDLSTMKPVWKRSFDETFDPLWAHGFARHDLTLVRQGELLIGLETSSGKALWSIKAGSEAPPIAASDAAIFMLVRRAKGPNLIYAIAPRTGKPLWYGAPPTGTLEIAYEGGTLLLKSIRSVQRAWWSKEDKAQDKP